MSAVNKLNLPEKRRVAVYCLKLATEDVTFVCGIQAFENFHRSLVFLSPSPSQPPPAPPRCFCQEDEDNDIS